MGGGGGGHIYVYIYILHVQYIYTRTYRNKGITIIIVKNEPLVHTNLSRQARPVALDLGQFVF